MKKIRNFLFLVSLFSLLIIASSYTSIFADTNPTYGNYPPNPAYPAYGNYPSNSAYPAYGNYGNYGYYPQSYPTYGYPRTYLPPGSAFPGSARADEIYRSNQQLPR